MNGVDSLKPRRDQDPLEVATDASPKPSEQAEPAAAIDDSSPDPLSQTDRYRLSMPYTDRL